jgi:hypothetical protein
VWINNNILTPSVMELELGAISNITCDLEQGLALSVPQFPSFIKASHLEPRQVQLGTGLLKRQVREWADQLCHPNVLNSVHPSVPHTACKEGHKATPFLPNSRNKSGVPGEFSLTNYFLFIGKKSCRGNKLLTKRKRRFCSEQILILAVPHL